LQSWASARRRGGETALQRNLPILWHRLPAGATADYDRETKTITCLTCHDRLPSRDLAGEPSGEPAGDPAGEPWVAGNLPAAVVPGREPAQLPAGQAGASAGREYQRRKARHEDTVRQAHPRLGGLILALSDEPQNVKA
jgi:hypothetical protein